MLNVISHQRNENQNHTITYSLVWLKLYTRQTLIGVGKHEKKNWNTNALMMEI